MIPVKESVCYLRHRDGQSKFGMVLKEWLLQPSFLVMKRNKPIKTRRPFQLTPIAISPILRWLARVDLLDPGSLLEVHLKTDMGKQCDAPQLESTASTFQFKILVVRLPVKHLTVHASSFLGLIDKVIHLGILLTGS